MEKGLTVSYFIFIYYIFLFFSEIGKSDVNEKVVAASHLNLKLLESLIVLSVITPYSGNPGKNEHLLRAAGSVTRSVEAVERNLATLLGSND